MPSNSNKENLHKTKLGTIKISCTYLSKIGWVSQSKYLPKQIGNVNFKTMAMIIFKPIYAYF